MIGALYNARPGRSNRPDRVGQAGFDGAFPGAGSGFDIPVSRACTCIQADARWSGRCGEVQSQPGAELTAAQSQNYDKSKGELIRERNSHVSCTGEIL